LIQNVHVFTEEYAQRLRHEAPIERVVVFDEAQRAWDSAQVIRSARTSRRGPGEVLVVDSEPHQMLGIMDRHPDWAVIVALVGGGQEIHTGEAGLAEWGKALAGPFSHWEVFASPEAVRGGESVAGSVLFPVAETGASPPLPSSRVRIDPALHLELSLRSFRASAFTLWVNATLAGDARLAAEVTLMLTEFPIFVTRSLHTLRAHLRARARGLRRPGLLASSGALRHRAYGIELSQSFRNDYPYEQWFLASPDDVRSSYQLEVAATEFECQGLELDFVGLCWGGDFIRDPSGPGWVSRRFAANRWLTVRDMESKQYLLNKYRVLLTRAREGLIIWVPPGSPTDPTLDPAYFDATFAYLKSCGLSEAPPN
jgi:hypothetical protein